ncbi:hypothetical protein Tco_0357586 [Tanacetum coccineum]
MCVVGGGVKAWCVKGEVTGQFLKELRDNTFSGSENKDENEHIERVLEIFDLFTTPDVTQDQLMLHVFPITLTGTQNKHPYLAVSRPKKIFGNMKRGFQGAPRPLLPSMLLVATNPIAGQEQAAQAQSQPLPPPPPIPSPTPTPISTSLSPPPLTPSPPPPPETEPTPAVYLYEKHSPVHPHFSPSQAQALSRMPMDDLLHTVPNYKQVKKLEGFLKRRNLVLTDSEDEEPEDQGRKSQADSQDSSIQGLVTPPTTKAHASGEEQEEDISPDTLESCPNSSQSCLFKVKINTTGEVNAAGEEVNTASKVNTGSIKLNTVIEQDSTAGEDKGQREGKAPMLSEETPKKSKEQILQEEASLAEAIRLDSLQREEEAEQIHLDALLAQRIAEEEELTEQQKKRKAQVQFEAQHYTNEDWDLIRAKLEANAELSKSMLGSELQGEDFAKKMVDLVNQRKKFFAEERAKAKRNKTMTQIHS